MLVGIPADLGIQLHTVDGIRFVFNWAIYTIGLIIGVTMLSTVDDHGAITSDVVTHRGSVGAVDWDQFVVSTKAVAVSVWVVKKTTLKHLVSTWFNAWYKMGG